MANIKPAGIAGLVALDDLDSKTRQEIIEAATGLARSASAQINNVDESEIAVRAMVFGDGTNSTDFEDLTGKTATVAGMEHWAEDSADLTGGDLSSIINANEKVDDNKVFVFFGFKDFSIDKDLTAIQFKRGSDTLAFWGTEHCYGKEDGGMVFEILVYEQNDPIDIKMNFRSGAADKNVVLLALVGEKYGEQLSKP